MIKNLIFIPIFAILTSCASQSFKYNEEPTSIVKNQTQYSVSNIDVKFIEGKAKVLEGNVIKFQRGEYKGYPNEKEMSVIIKDMLMQNLKDLNIYSKNSDLKITVEIEYERLLNDTFSSLSYLNFVMSHKVKILQNDNVIAESNSEDYTVKRFPFALLVRALSGNNGAQNEVKDLQKVLKSLTKEIYSVGK